MEPELDPNEFVYCTGPSGTIRQSRIDASNRFSEKDGETLILRRAEAEKSNLTFTFPCKQITLGVHSGLEAVGFIARIT
jgi:hypothetical protein